MRVRFAPSPTGDLHIGGVRTALFTWLFARQHGGAFVLRIEDTDQKRYQEESIASITSALRWMGLDWDEGPDAGGKHGPYFQSQRLPLYQEEARALLHSGHAYECFCQPERLDAVRAQQIASRQPPGYDRHCRTLNDEQRAAKRAEGIVPVIRLKIPLDGVTIVQDELRGPVSYENRLLEDAVLLKSDGFPTYHLAVVIDDHLMEISHITRGDEWLPSAPLHIMLYEAFGWESPLIFHTPVILNQDGRGKLSKRQGAASALAFREQGYLPEALRNYLMLLGWSYDDHQEVFPTVDELLGKFDLWRVNPSPSRFSYDKVLWFNQHYINHIIELDDLTRRCMPWLRRAGLVGDAPEGSAAHAHAREAIALIKDKMKLLGEAPDLTRFFFTDVDEYDAASLIQKNTEPANVVLALQRARDIVSATGVDDEAAIEEQLRALAGELGLKAGQLFMPIRVAVTGRTASPGLFETLRVVGQQRTVERLDAAIARLGQND
ncbi:MAG TPA: glutamate--tRNA ligase [Thermomicrobiales bacterium]|nr:glutamate--tRNA ligase [Thermomicrobiales bacterium]